MKYIFLQLIFICSVLVTGQQDEIALVEDGRSSYSIRLSGTASVWDSLAAEELQKYVIEISGAAIPIVGDSHPASEREIIIGNNRTYSDIDVSGIHHRNGFLIKTSGRKIHFIGGAEKGTLYAIYTFLEKYLDCQMYSSTVRVIPKSDTIVVPVINLVENPAFDYRSIYYRDALDDAYSRWHKLSDSGDRNIWGMFVHTFSDLLPPEKFLNEHPEYFALINGTRMPEQPCLSHPDVFRHMVDALRQRMKKNPGAVIWSVSQNDNEAYCRCPDCAALDERESTPTGSVLNFVNKVAAEFPDKTISTLAYLYSRKAPSTIKPETNVNIMLCSIESYRTHPLSSDSSFVRDLSDWSALTDNIFLWDYVMQFTNYVSPFPNLHVLQPNVQLFRDYGVNMIFEQGAGLHSEGAEFRELRTYLLAKLLWDPDIDVDSLMNEFLEGYYGNAGTFLREYIDLMKDNLKDSGTQLSIYGDPVESMFEYLSPTSMAQYRELFTRAEEAVRHEPEFLKRVRIAKLPLLYAELEQAKAIGIGERGTIVQTPEDSYTINPYINNLLDEFAAGCKLAGDVLIHERRLYADEYVTRYSRMLSGSMDNPLALFKPVRYITLPSEKYPANGQRTLTDGLRGDEDHRFNWQGFEGEDMEAVVDLEEPVVIRQIDISFLQIVFSWIFLPSRIEISVSMDGEIFHSAAIIENEIPPDRDGSFIHTFTAQLDPVETRYVKVKASSIKTCPDWHPGRGGKAWIFTDEIRIE